MRRTSDFGELLHTALPLAVVALISSFGVFADRFFLGRHSQSALAAVTPAAVLANTFFCFIVTTVSYTGTFIAHYYAGGRQRQAVRTFAQGLWLSGLSVIAFLVALPIGNLFIRASCPSAAARTTAHPQTASLPTPSCHRPGSSSPSQSPISSAADGSPRSLRKPVPISNPI